MMAFGLLGCTRGESGYVDAGTDGDLDAGMDGDLDAGMDDGGADAGQNTPLLLFGYDPSRGANDDPSQNPYGGNTFFIATDGSDDNDGGSNAPWATFAHANRVVAPGDQVFVRAGVYYEYVSLGGFDGNPDGYCIGLEDQPIVWRAYPGERVILDGSLPQVPTGMLSIRNARWVVIRDFEVQDSTCIGIALQQSSDLVLDNLLTHDNNGSGVGCVDIERVTFRFITARDNFDSAGEGGNADGIAIGSGSDNRFYRCVSHDNSDDGFDTWESTGNELAECVAHRNGKGAAGDGNGFKNGGGSMGGGNFIHHCIAFENRTSGFASNTGSGNEPNTYFNNTGWNNGDRGDFWLVNLDHVARNNLALGPNGVTIYAEVDDRTNSWNDPPGITVSEGDFLSLDPEALQSNFLRLAPGAPEINAGEDVALPFAGLAPDLGAFERE